MSERPRLRGDEAQLYRDLAAELHHVVSRRVHASPEIIDDACATAWLHFLGCQPRRATAWGWLLTTACRQAWQLAAEQRRTTTLSAEPVSADRATVEEVVEVLDDLARASRELRDRERRLLALHAAGYTYLEIATLVRSTVRAVDRHLVRGRARLRRIRR